MWCWRDLPCSGLGVLGRKKDIRYRVQEEDLHALAALQSADPDLCGGLRDARRHAGVQHLHHQ